MDVSPDLMRMRGAQVPIASLTRLRLEIAVEATQHVAAIDRAAMLVLATSRADDSGHAAGKAKGVQGIRCLRLRRSAVRRSVRWR